MTNLGMSVFIDDLVALALRVFGSDYRRFYYYQIVHHFKEKNQIQKLMPVT
jgi:hypothetical protein